MTDEAIADTAPQDTGSAMLPALVSSLLALIWGAHTIVVAIEISGTPFPTV
jgi:hypothetical protein